MAESTLLNTKVTKIMDCAASVAVSDLIYLSPSTDNLAVTAIDNQTPTPVIGIVLSKPTNETCKVLLLGLAKITIARGTLRLGTDGQFTTSCVLTGKIQNLGVSFGDGNIFFNPSQTRVQRR